MYFAQYGTLNVEWECWEVNLSFTKTKRCRLFLRQILWFPSCGGHTATLPLSKLSWTLRVVLQNGICCRPKRVRKRLVLYPEEGHTAGAWMPFLSQTDVGLSCHCLVLGTPLSALLFLITVLGNGATNRRSRLRWKTDFFLFLKPHDASTVEKIKSSVMSFGGVFHLSFPYFLRLRAKQLLKESHFFGSNPLKYDFINGGSSHGGLKLCPDREIRTRDSIIVPNFQVFSHCCAAAGLQATLMRP